MALTKQNQKMLIFVSTRNPIWGRVLKLPPEQIKREAVNRIVGISNGTYYNWRKGNRISSDAMRSVIEKSKETVKPLDSGNGRGPLGELIGEFERYLFDTRRLISDLAELLGMTLRDCQYILDEALYHSLPVFPEMYYDNTARGEEIAEEEYDRFKGIYKVYVRRLNFWFLCPLSVKPDRGGDCQARIPGYDRLLQPRRAGSDLLARASQHVFRPTLPFILQS